MAAARRAPLLAAALGLVLAVVLAACGGGAKKPQPTATSTPAPAAASDTGCTKATPRGEKVARPKKPKGRLDARRTTIARVTTNCGTFEITLDVKRAPKTAASFASLARQGFYDGLTFHRVVSGFVVQGGDPEGNGSGGPGYHVREAPPRNLAYRHGVVAMAKTQADPAGTSGSQFFIVTGQDAALPPDYALVGRVTKGLDVVDAIGALPTRPDDQPDEPVVMKSVQIVTR